MADVFLTLGGPYRSSMCRIGRGGYDGTVNVAPERIAGEYMHGFFTAGNSLNPAISIGQAEALRDEKVGAGDFIGLFMIPEHHTLLDAAIRVITSQPIRGYPTKPNVDGMVVTYEARIYDVMTGEQKGKVDFATPLASIPANEEVFKRSPIKPDTLGHFVPTGEIVVLGLKVDSLPSDSNTTIADITGRIEITAHALDYEVPMHV